MAREMKNSEVKWIGEIPRDWDVSKIKFLITNGSNSLRVGPFGSTMSGNDFTNEGYWVYNQRSVLDNNFEDNDTFVGENKYNELKAFKVYSQDILITTRGSIGKVAIVPEKHFEGILHPCIIRFVLNDEKYNKYFLKHIFNGTDIVQQQIKNKSNSTTIDVLYSATLKNLVVPFPPLSEQRAIAEFLDAKCAEIDGLLADLDAEVKTLAEYKKSIIAETVTHGFNPNAPMKSSGISWADTIPAHWKVQKGKYTFTLLQRPVKEDDGVVTCFRDGEVTLRSNRREDGFTMSAKEYGYQGIEPGDLVVHGMDGFAGSIGISDSRGKGTPVLNVLDSDQNKRYLMYYLRNMAYGDVFLALSTGIRVRSCDLGWKKLGEIRIVLPPIEEQDQIADYIDRKLDEIQNAVSNKLQQIETLKAYKASLIYEYVTGKKQVI